MSTPSETVQRVASLREIFEPFMSQRVNDSSLYVDLADIYEVSEWYVAAIDDLIRSGANDKKKIEAVLYEVQAQLILHLGYHLKSLVKCLPRAIADTNES